MQGVQLDLQAGRRPQAARQDSAQAHQGLRLLQVQQGLHAEEAPQATRAQHPPHTADMIIVPSAAPNSNTPEYITSRNVQKGSCHKPKLTLRMSFLITQILYEIPIQFDIQILTVIDMLKPRYFKIM